MVCGSVGICLTWPGPGGSWEGLESVGVFVSSVFESLCLGVELPKFVNVVTLFHVQNQVRVHKSQSVC